MQYFKTALSAVLAALIVAACAGFAGQPPDLSLVNIEPLKGGNLEQRFRLTFRILNRGNRILPLSGVNYAVKLQGIEFMTGASSQDLKVEPLSETTFSVDAGTDIFKAGRLLLELFRSKPETLDYELDAELHTGSAFGRRVPIRRSGTISLKKDNWRGAFDPVVS